MLILSRQRDQVIEIGPDIKVMVVDIRGDKVRLGIVAPKGVDIYREEVPTEERRNTKANISQNKTEGGGHD